MALRLGVNPPWQLFSVDFVQGADIVQCTLEVNAQFDSMDALEVAPRVGF